MSIFMDSESRKTEIFDTMLMVTQPVSEDRHHEGFSIYHFEVGEIGFSVSAKSVSTPLGQIWYVREWSTYNA